MGGAVGGENGSQEEGVRVIALANDDACAGCPLYHHRSHSVGFEFVGEPPYEYVFVGEAPGNEEVLNGRPFVGRSGQLLRRALSESGVSSYILANAVMCPPFSPGSPVSSPDPQVVRYCSGKHLLKFLKRVRPKKVVLLGKSATEGVLGNLIGDGFQSGLPMSEYRSRYYGYEDSGTAFFPTNHPSYVLRRGGESSQDYQRFLSDIGSVLEFVLVPEVGSEEPVSYTYYKAKGKLPATPAGASNYKVFDLDSYQEGFSHLEEMSEVSFDVETSTGDTDVDRELIMVGLGNHQLQVCFDLRRGNPDNAVGFFRWLKRFLDSRKRVIVYNQSFEAGVYLQLFGEFVPFTDVFSMVKAFGLQTELFQKVGLKKVASAIFGVEEWSDRVQDYVELSKDMHENFEDWREYVLISRDSLKESKRRRIEETISRLGFSEEEVAHVFGLVSKNPDNPMIGWAAIPTDILARYNAEDVRWTHELYLFLHPLYPEEVWEVYQKQEVLGSLMHQVKIRFDPEAASRYREAFSEMATRSFYEIVSNPRLMEEAIVHRANKTRVRDVPEVREALSLAYRVNVRVISESFAGEPGLVEKYKQAYQKLLSSPVVSPEAEPADLSHLVSSRSREVVKKLREAYRKEYLEDLAAYGREEPEAWVERMSKWFNPSSSKANIGVLHRALTCMPLVFARYIDSVVLKVLGPDDLRVAEAEVGPVSTWATRWEEVIPALFGERWRETVYGRMLSEWDSIASGINDEYVEYLYKLFRDYLGEDFSDYPALKVESEELAQCARLLASLRLYKKALKMITAYLDGKNGLSSVHRSSEIVWKGIPIPVYDREGKAHYYESKFFVNSADTRRWRSPFHTVPTGTEVREVYVSRWEEEGIWVHFDYSQMELRVLAAISGDENMLGAFRSGVDLHRYVASKIFKISPEEVSSHQRKIAKGASFSIVYGQTPSGFAAEYTGGDVEEAKRIFDEFFAHFPRVREYINRYRAMARVHGHVPTMFGDWIDVQRDKPDWERRAQNYPIQSSSSSIAALSGYEISMRAIGEGIRAVPLAFTHDALDFDVHASDLIRFIVLVKSVALEVPARYGVYADIEMEIGTSFFGGLHVHSVSGEPGEDGSFVLEVSGREDVYRRVVQRLSRFYRLSVEELEEGEGKNPFEDIFAPKRALSVNVGKTFKTVSSKIRLGVL